MDGEDYPKELASRGGFRGKRKRRFCRTNKPGGERKNSKTRVAWEEAIASEDPSIQPASAVDRLTTHLASSAASRKTTKKELGEALKTAVTDAQQAREEMLMAREDATEVNRRCDNLKRRVDNLLASVCETNQLLHQTKKEAREVSLENAVLRSQLEDQHLQFDVVLREAIKIAAAKAKVSITDLHCQLLLFDPCDLGGSSAPEPPLRWMENLCI
jgi:regulator of replication initiation timing